MTTAQGLFPKPGKFVGIRAGLRADGDGTFAATGVAETRAEEELTAAATADLRHHRDALTDDYFLGDDGNRWSPELLRCFLSYLSHKRSNGKTQGFQGIPTAKGPSPLSA